MNTIITKKDSNAEELVWIGELDGVVELVWVAVVGAAVGAVVGAAVGAVVGAAVGAVVGAAVGSVVGAGVGAVVGAAVEADVGEAVGAAVGTPEDASHFRQKLTTFETGLMFPFSSVAVMAKK